MPPVRGWEVPVNLDDEERALLALWQHEFRTTCDDTEETLRVLGYNRRERQALRHHGHRRGKHRPSRDRHRETILKQFAWYIERRVDNWTSTALTPAQVAAIWAKLTGYNLDRATVWWSAGLSPLALQQITDLIANGLTPEDLARRVQHRTILEEINRGSSVTWCLNAARWAQRD